MYIPEVARKVGPTIHLEGFHRTRPELASTYFNKERTNARVFYSGDKVYAIKPMRHFKATLYLPGFQEKFHMYLTTETYGTTIYLPPPIALEESSAY